MAITLTAKEQMLIQDQKCHEELCIQKYQNGSKQAQDPQLKELFNSLAQKEQEHLDSINQILSGQVPSIPQGQPSQGNNQYQAQGSGSNPNDATLCNDMLATEKYVSSTYDTTIFECVDTNVRQVLNHIQKEEQEHGEQIFNYMQSAGMYNPQ